MLKVATRVPATAGLNVIDTVQLTDAARLVAHVLLEISKSAALVPEMDTLVMVIEDVPPFIEPVTKFNATVDDVARFPDMVRPALRWRPRGTPGPVHLQFRGNEGQVDADEAEMEPLWRAAVRARAGVSAGAGRRPA